MDGTLYTEWADQPRRGLVDEDEVLADQWVNLNLQELLGHEEARRHYRDQVNSLYYERLAPEPRSWQEQVKDGTLKGRILA